MITDKVIQIIFDWADKNDIKNRGLKEEDLISKKINWRKGIPRRKNNLLEVEYLILDFYSKIKNIPSELFKLPKLKGLDIPCNLLILLSKDELKNITHLHISLYHCKNKLNLMSDLFQKINIEDFIYLSIDEFSIISNELFDMKNLKHLVLRWGKFREIPKEIGKLSALEKLEVYSCDNLKGLPKEIGNLKRLKELDLRWNKNLKELPREIGNLMQLKELDLRSTAIEEMPDEFSNLINLEYLNGQPYIQMKSEEFNTSNESDFIVTQLEKTFSTKKEGNIKSFKIKNLLLKGVPGTGKSRAIENIINNKLELKDHKENILRINIHSASSNADLMQGIGISSKDGKIEYKEKQGLILNLIQRATFNPNQPFVLILEEIQENSLNELIGDLIYLIEEDKRAKNMVADDEEYGYQELVEKIVADNPETAYVEIPYLVNDSTEYRKMIMPNNLYIFCTSNYRDDKKVIEDNLLRRFEVLEIYPKVEVVHEYCKEFFSKLNENILEVMSDEIHPDRFLIGHSNWLKVENQEAFYRAFLKVVVEFKDIKEVEFSDFEEIVEKLPLVDALDLSSYKALIEDLQTKAGYDFLD
jgi:Leucine-rich repeat (LRR) protein